MSSIVEMCFNPYLCSTQILINGKPPSDYSSLIQYMTVPLYEWYDRIIDLLYNEINDSFSLLFIGRKFDAEIIRSLVEQSEECVAFSHKEFMVDTPLQKRLVVLNEIIKKNRSNIEKTKINIDFIITDDFFNTYIRELDVRNRFCFVEKYIYSINEYLHSNCHSEYLFILCKNYDEIYQINSQAKCVFAIKLEQSESYIEYKQGIIFISTSRDKVFDTLFDCLLHAPLCDIYTKCTKALSGNKNIVFTDSFRILTAIKPLVKVDMPKTVEMGKSISLSIYTEPKMAELPMLEFEYDHSGVVNCTNQRIEGLREGIVNILLYEKGSNQPFDLKQVRVIKRNRITSLLLTDKQIVLGEGDRKNLSVTYFPEDADNADQIEWYSTDETVVKVDSKGKLQAVSKGECQVICSAENVSNRMSVEVKPYLEDLEINNFNIEEVTDIALSEETVIDISPLPIDAIDSSFTISSANTLVVNVIGKTIHPVSLGETQVNITNSSGRIKKTIYVRVVKKIKNKSSEKRSFWDIFRKK